MLRRSPVLAALAILLAPVVGAQTHANVSQKSPTTVRLYRYSLTTRIGDNQYLDEIQGSTPPAAGPSFRVTRDRLGRVTQTQDLRDGKPVTTWKYHYTGLSKWFDGYEDWEGGELIGTTKVTRDANNVIVRYDHFTAQGDPTTHTAIQDLGDKMEQDSLVYGVDNKPTTHSHLWFSPSGYLIRQMNYMSPASDANYVDIQFEEHTGHTISSKQVENGKLINTKKDTWEADGDLSRVDVYDESGVWYSADEFADGLHTRRLYKFTTGGTKEVRYSYDSRRWLTKSVVYHNDQLICTLTYDRLPDGSIKRTLATAPDGTLMAEYPPPMVTDVGIDGQSPGRTDAILHKSGDWWTLPPQNYHSADGRFTVSFPGGTVGQDTKAVSLDGGGSSTMYEFWVSADSGNTTYLVMYNDYPSNYANDGPQNVLGRVRDAEAKDQTLVTDTVIDLNGVPGRAFVVTNTDKQVTYTVHVFLNGHRLYQVAVASKVGTPPAYADQFFSSFQLM